MMATTEIRDGSSQKAGDEVSLNDPKDQAPDTKDGSEGKQKTQDTPAAKDDNEEELEEGELIDDDDDDDDDDDNDKDDKQVSSAGPPPWQNNNRDGLGNNAQNAVGPAIGGGQANSGQGMTGPGNTAPGGNPQAGGPVQRVNVRCRFYSKTINKCTWGDQCRFEHRDDSPDAGEQFDHRGLPGPPQVPMPMRRPPGPALPPLGPADRPYPPFYGARNQPYPMMPHGYGMYDPYGPPQPPHHQSPPLPPHFMHQPHHWRHHQQPPQQQGLLYHPSPPGLPHPPPFESMSPPHPSNAVPGPSGHSGPSQPEAGGPNSGSSVPSGGAPSPSHRPSPSSPASSAVYERKHRLAYELAPWNDRGGGAYPGPAKYDRADPASMGGYPTGRGNFYRNQYNRDPYGREHQGPPPYHMPDGGPPHSSYHPNFPPNYPSNYNRGGPMGSHPSHYRYMSSSHRNMPLDGGRLRPNKRGHDEDESSWSDSGSEDSILGQASYNKSHSSKSNKKSHHQHMQAHQANNHPGHRGQSQSTDAQAALTSSDHEASNNDYFLDQGSGTPPGEPLPEDKERQEMLLNKLKEIEDLMAKKKGEQQEPSEQENLS